MEERQALPTNNTNRGGGQHKVVEVAPDGVGHHTDRDGHALRQARAQVDDYGGNVGAGCRHLVDSSGRICEG